MIKPFTTLCQWLAYGSASLILAMSFLITYDVVARTAFGISSPWVFDLSEYSLVWVTFLAAPWVLLKDRHVRIEILVDIIGVRFQRALGVFVSIVALITCLVLFWRTGLAAIDYYDRGVMTPRIWSIPRVWPYIAVPVGSALLVGAFLIRVVTYVRSDDPEATLRAERSSAIY